MISKTIFIALASTGALGTGAANGLTPAGIELAAGPLRIESGHGTIVKARIANSSQGALTINLKSGKTLIIRF